MVTAENSYGESYESSQVSATPSSTAPEGLIAYYPFNGNANDQSGNGNHGTLYGATLTTDRNGNANSACSFDGVNDYVQTNAITPNVNAGTFEVWVNPDYDSGSGIRTGIMHWGKGITDGDKKSYCLVDYEGNVYFQNGWSGPHVKCSGLIKGQWYHLVGTWEVVAGSADDILRIYINGNLVAETTNADLGATINDPKIEIGRHRENYWYFNGIIDNVRIYNRALSESEIQTLYNE